MFTLASSSELQTDTKHQALMHRDEQHCYNFSLVVGLFMVYRDRLAGLR